GAAEVDLHAQVAAVGQPLRLRVEAPGVAPPGAAVDVEHGGQAGAGRVGREGEVAVHLEAVAGGVGERLHLGEPVALQLRPVHEQEGGLAGGAVPGVVGDRAVVGGEGQQPGPVGVVAAEDRKSVV